MSIHFKGGYDIHIPIDTMYTIDVCTNTDVLVNLYYYMLYI